MVGVLPSDGEIFPSAYALGVPLLKAEDFEPSYLVPHRQKVRTEYPPSGGRRPLLVGRRALRARAEDPAQGPLLRGGRRRRPHAGLLR